MLDSNDISVHGHNQIKPNQTHNTLFKWPPPFRPTCKVVRIPPLLPVGRPAAYNKDKWRVSWFRVTINDLKTTINTINGWTVHKECDAWDVGSTA